MKFPEKQDAVIRQIEIIGEAVSHRSPECKEIHSTIKWRDIIGMRNMLIHQYFGVDLIETYQTATVDVPELYMAISKILHEE